MFLHSGASLHGHEYSNRPAPGSAQVLNRRSPLLRSPFSPPLPRNATGSPTQQARLPVTPPSTPPPSAQQLQSCLPQSQFRLPRFRWSTQEDPVVRFQEPPPDDVDDVKPESVIATSSATVISDEEGSCSEASDLGSAAGAVARNRTRRRRLPRQSTTYFFARPPPRLVKKRLMTQIRPKLLLQIHQLSLGKRPTPKLDVFPASTIAGPALGGRFAKRFPRIFGVMGDRSDLGSQDVILLRSEEYCTESGEGDGTVQCDGDDDNLNNRELVAVLSPLKREDRTEIVLYDGSVWVAEPLANGSFEFTHTDALGALTTARWVRRSLTKATGPTSPTMEMATGLSGYPFVDSGSPSTSSLATPVQDEYRYTFSVINPLSRRHPIMATLTHNALDILENYTTISTSYGKYPPTRPFSHTPSFPSVSSDDEDDEEGGAPLPKTERESRPVDVATQNLISITAVWVTLRLGGTMTSTESPRNASLRASATRSNANCSINGGLNLQNGGSTSPTAVSKREPSLYGLQTPTLGSSGGGGAMAPRRATSTGAAFMQRRMQMSDASDSERPAVSRLRLRGRRVLSGDWNVGAWKRHSNSQVTGFNAGDKSPISPMLQHQQQQQQQTPPRFDATTPPVWTTPTSGSSNRRPISGQVVTEHAPVQLERRVQSAIYTTSPLVSLDAAVEADSHGAAVIPTTENPVEAGGLPGQEGVAGSAEAEADNEEPERKWKRLGQWIRRLTH